MYEPSTLNIEPIDDDFFSSEVEVVENYSVKQGLVGVSKKIKKTLSSIKEETASRAEQEGNPVVDQYMKEVSKNELIPEEKQEQDLGRALQLEYDKIIKVFALSPNTFQLLKEFLGEEWQKKLQNQNVLNLLSDCLTKKEGPNVVANDLTKSLQTDLSEDKHDEILTSIKEIHRVAKIFMEKNLALVISIANKNKWRTTQANFPDLIQEGNEGLARAAYRFSPNHGAKFGTYARWWIWQAIVRFSKDNEQEVRLPTSAKEGVSHFWKAYYALQTELLRKPSFQEVGEALIASGFSEEDVEKIKSNLRCKVFSLEDPLANEDSQEFTFGDSITQETVPNIEETVQYRELQQRTIEVLNTGNMTDRERLIICLRFGINIPSVSEELNLPLEKRDYTLEELGRFFEITRERIRQIEAQALKKLRHPSRIEMLKGFL